MNQISCSLSIVLGVKAESVSILWLKALSLGLLMASAMVVIWTHAFGVHQALNNASSSVCLLAGVRGNYFKEREYTKVTKKKKGKKYDRK